MPQRPRLEVVRSGVEPVVPKQGDVVTARVIRINPRLAAGAAARWPATGVAVAGDAAQAVVQWPMVHMCAVTAPCSAAVVVAVPPFLFRCLAFSHQHSPLLPRPVDILCVGDKPVQQRYSGVIRVQDVRATELDKVRVRWSRRSSEWLAAAACHGGQHARTASA